MNPEHQDHPTDRSLSDLENRLAARPLRSAPAELRRRVLLGTSIPACSASGSDAVRTAAPAARPRLGLALKELAGFLHHHLSSTGGALGACWLAIGLLAIADVLLDRTSAPKAAQASNEQAAVARTERDALLQFAGVETARRPLRQAVGSPKLPPSPRPRGDWRQEARDFMILNPAPDNDRSHPICIVEPLTRKSQPPHPATEIRPLDSSCLT